MEENLESRCDCCGKPVSQLKPFGGPGDPVIGDFSGALLVKRYRPHGPHIEDAEKAWELAEFMVPEEKDPLPWFISEYGEKMGTELYWAGQAHGTVSKSYECRDCIVLDTDHYFEKMHPGFLEWRDIQAAERKRASDKTSDSIDPIADVSEPDFSPDEQWGADVSEPDFSPGVQWAMESSPDQKRSTLRKEDENGAGSIQ